MAAAVALTVAGAAVAGVSAWFFFSGRGFFKASFKERSMLEYVVEHSSFGDPGSVIAALDQWNETSFNMSAGKTKGAIVDEIIAEKKPKLFLELGGYVGYSAIRFGNQQRQALGDEAKEALYLSVEIDPLFAAISTKLLERAGLQDSVKVIIGTLSTSVDLIKQLVAGRVGCSPDTTQPFDMIFIDHWKDMYVTDFLNLEELGFIAKGTTIIADNIVVPGVPAYRKLLIEEKAGEYESKLIEAPLLSHGRFFANDALLLSVRK